MGPVLVSLLACGTASTPETDAGTPDASPVDSGIKRDAAANGDGGYVSEVGDVPPAAVHTPVRP
jgi:hypothetical protein